MAGHPNAGDAWATCETCRHLQANASTVNAGMGDGECCAAPPTLSGERPPVYFTDTACASHAKHKAYIATIPRLTSGPEHD